MRCGRSCTGGSCDVSSTCTWCNMLECEPFAGLQAVMAAAPVGIVQCTSGHKLLPHQTYKPFSCRRQALGLGEHDLLSNVPDEAPVDEPPVGCEPPPAYPALQARRDSVRGWLCALYAFAAPNRHVAEVLAGCWPPLACAILSSLQ